MSASTPRVLVIAGSDSGGGAGIQADLKAFAAAGVHGTTAITALTAQNTVGVTRIEAVAPAMIAAQVEAVAADIGIDAVKVGMLGDEATIAAVAAAIETLGDVPVVVDPVMVSESGAVLLEEGARQALVERILPLARVVTPNIAEARVLAAARTGVEASQLELARAILALGPQAVIVTGGHLDGADLLLENPTGEGVRIEGPVHPDGAAHGVQPRFQIADACVGALERFVPRQPELVFEMNIGGGDKGVNPDLGPSLQRLPGAVDVGRLGARQTADRRPFDLVGNRPDRFKVAGGAIGETGFDNIDPQPHQLFGDRELFLDVHAGAGRLLSVPKGGIENLNDP